jgi:hypothetical protein
VILVELDTDIATGAILEFGLETILDEPGNVLIIFLVIFSLRPRSFGSFESSVSFG